MKELIKNCKSVCEFGGRSPLFEETYKLFPDIDGYNLFKDNYWQKEFKDTYIGNGKQFNQDVVDIVSDLKYDLVLNSHVIEHFANPIKALMHWKELLNKDGLIYSIIPDKHYTFDINRPLTTIDHLLQDGLNKVEEDDETHIKEAIELFVNNGGYDFENYVKSSKFNKRFRAIHHHCFDASLVKKMFEVCGYKTIKQYQTGMHIHTLCKLTS